METEDDQFAMVELTKDPRATTANKQNKRILNGNSKMIQNITSTRNPNQQMPLLRPSASTGLLNLKPR